MNKSELVAAIAEKAELSKKDAEKAVKAFTDTVAEQLKAGEKIQLVGSSRISRLALESISFASETLPRSPPLKSRMYLNTSSSVKRNAARVFLICVLLRSGYAS